VRQALQVPLAQLVMKRNRYSKTYFLAYKKLLLITCSRCCSTGSPQVRLGHLDQRAQQELLELPAPEEQPEEQVYQTPKFQFRIV
jgi:hypothetical protein